MTLISYTNHQVRIAMRLLLSAFKKWHYLWSGILAVCLCINCNAQTDADITFRQDTAKLRQVWKILDKETNADSAAKLLDRATTMPHFFDKRYTTMRIGFFLKTGETYCDNGRYLPAKSCMARALPDCITPGNKANYYSHLAWVDFTVGNYLPASENLYLALKSVKEVKDSDPNKPKYEIPIHRLLGLVYFRLHQGQKSIYFFNNAEAIARKWQILPQLAQVLLCKGDYYIATSQLDSAEKYYNDAVETARKTHAPKVMAEGSMGLGKVFIAAKNYGAAVLHLQSAIDATSRIDKTTAINAAYYLGEALYCLHKYREAEATLTAAIKQAEAIELNDNLVQGYTTLANVYTATAQYKKALACMDSIGVIKDSLVNAEKAKAINLMDIKYQTAEKDKQIAQQTGKLARKNIWIISICSGVVLLLLVSAGIYLNTLHKQRLNFEYLKSLEKENKIGILKAVVLGGDNERSRIARELHDGIGGMLSAAMMRLSAMPRESDAVAAMPSYSEGMKILNEMGDEIRKTAHNLMPDVLLRQSLPDAINTFCNSIHESGALQINFQSYGVFSDLSQNYKLNLYRIVQELIKNILQHAKATRALVQLLLNDTVLMVAVEDNGIGFNVHEVKNGIGLHNAQTRASSLDGSFTIESNPGKGTSVFIEFKRPLNY